MLVNNSKDRFCSVRSTYRFSTYFRLGWISWDFDPRQRPPSAERREAETERPFAQYRSWAAARSSLGQKMSLGCGKILIASVSIPSLWFFQDHNLDPWPLIKWMITQTTHKGSGYYSEHIYGLWLGMINECSCDVGRILNIKSRNDKFSILK